MLVNQDDPQQTVQIFIDLIQRHEQSFYYFVHKVHSKGEGLFSGLMHWIELFLDIVREGLGEPISLEFILPHTGDERRDTMKEIDEVALHHYKQKIAYESKLRRRFGRAGGADIGGDDENAREIVGGLVRDVSLGDFMKGGMLDVAAEEEESSDDSEESSSDYESDADDGETVSEESSENSSRPPAQLRRSPSIPTLPNAIPRRAQESFPPSQPSKLAVPPPAKSPSLSPSRAPSVASPSSTGTRLRKLSLTLRKSRSMTFGAARPSSSNNAESPPPPVPPVPPLSQPVAQSRSAAPPTASRSKQLPSLPPQPQSSLVTSSASPSRRPAPNARASEKKRYPSQNLPQAPKPKRQSKPASGALKPPELKKIAELLPIFVEMVCVNFSPVARGSANGFSRACFVDAPLATSTGTTRGTVRPEFQPSIDGELSSFVSIVYSLGTTENFCVFSLLRTLHAQRKNGVYWCSLGICITSDNKYS
jgi:hypothetical protein